MYMKYLIQFLLILPLISFSQNDSTITFKVLKDSTEQIIYEAPEILAEFPGGIFQLNRWLASEVKYPEEALNKGIQSKVYVKFIIEIDGSVSNIEIINKKQVHPLLEEEVKRVINKMPRWNPALNGGQLVRSYFIIPINFELKSEKSTSNRKRK